MKRLMMACEALIVFIVLVKLMAMGGYLANFKVAQELLSVERSIAETTVENVEAAGQDNKGPEKHRDDEESLINSLREKDRQIRLREERLRMEEGRLEALKKEILAKIENLKEREANVSLCLDQLNQFSGKRYKSLAKVYEAAPPQQASSMLEKLDIKTAASIIMNMKSAKAGLVWGNMEPSRAVAITKEITSFHLTPEHSNSSPQ